MADVENPVHNPPNSKDGRSIREYLGEPVTESWTDLLLIVCCFTTGLLDGAVFNVWSCFVSMQTGKCNTLYVGLGVSGQPKDQPYRWAKSGTAIISFVLGSYIYSRAMRYFGPLKRTTIIGAFATGALLCFVSAALVQAGIVPPDAGKIVPKNNIVLLPLCLLSISAAGQIIVSRFLGYSELTTVVLTSAYCDLAHDEKVLSAPLTKNSKRNRRVASMVMTCVGAIAGGFLTYDGDIAPAIWIAGGLKVVIGIVLIFWKSKPAIQLDDKTFNTASYAAVRPSYPQKLYDLILNYHQGPREQGVDLGCGHGIVARQFGHNFTRFLGTDPSQGMIEQARKLTPVDEFPGVQFRISYAHDEVPCGDGTVDMVTAAEAVHWFDLARVFPLLAKKVRQGGSLAFWGYKDHVFVDHPKSNAVMDGYVYAQDKDRLGPYWPEGRQILSDNLRAIKPPEQDWEDIQRIEYEPGMNGPASGQGTLLMSKTIKVGECKAYIRTWSSYHGWSEAHPDQKPRDSGGHGDVVDIMFDEMAAVDEVMGSDENEVTVEWGSAFILARRKQTTQ